MLNKLLINSCILIVLCKTLVLCQTLDRDSEQNSITKNEMIEKQFNHWSTGQLPPIEWPPKEWPSKQWPSAQWNPNQWPNSKWNSSQWPSAEWRPTPLPGSHWTGWTHNTSIPQIVIQLPTTLKPITLYPPLPSMPFPPTLHPVTYPPVTEPPTIPSESESEAIEIITSTTTTSQNPTHFPITWKPWPIQGSTAGWTFPTQGSTTSRPNPPPAQTTARPTYSTRPPYQPPINQTEDPNAITVKSCGLSHIPQAFIGNKIVSGKLAKGGEFPWQVILKIYTSKGPMQCGGSILNSRWILTAAHCVSNERNGQPTAQKVDITAGVHNRLVMSAGSQQRVADCVIQHELWTGQTGKFKNDIALLRLPTDKLFDINYEKGGNINGICLPTKPNSEFSGKARIAGWGLTRDKGSPSDVLLYTDVSIMSNENCRKYPYPVPIADSMMCQGVDKTAPCQGDSGGPLIISISDSRGVQRMTEVGIVSFGPGQCANPSTPNAIYTKTSHFLPWIQKTIKANSGQKCMSRALKTDNSDDKIQFPFITTTMKPIII